MTEQHYVGGELELFAAAERWKSYWASRIAPYLRGAVLEVGAGLGSNTPLLRRGADSRWVCLEPDPALATALRAAVAPAAEVRTGTVASLDAGELFDCILYIDVLEHIGPDREEVEHAARHLRPGGHLIVLSPAHGWLFSPFDRAIGHYRRYTTGALRALTPATLRVERCFYLDSVGMLASAANRLLLRQSLPNAGQIRLWDRVMVPCSRLLDPCLGYSVGKSVVCVWKREGGERWM